MSLLTHNHGHSFTLAHTRAHTHPPPQPLQQLTFIAVSTATLTVVLIVTPTTDPSILIYITPTPHCSLTASHHSPPSLNTPPHHDVSDLLPLPALMLTEQVQAVGAAVAELHIGQGP